MTNKITISGFAGSGKSSVGKIIQEKLKFEFISVGNYSRDFAKNHYNLSINEFQEKCKIEPELDILIDKKFREQCNNKDHLVIDYRLGFYFIKNALHVLLKVSDEIASKRISSDNRTNEKTGDDDIKVRNEAMRNRFQQNYHVDFTNEDNYDLVINTDKLTIYQVADQIVDKYNELKNSEISLSTIPKINRAIPSINFHLWEPCNMRCKFCFATFKDVKQTILPKGHLPENEALEVVKKIAAAGFEKITFAGGEPLLCKWLPNLIRTAKELGMTTMIVTNGSKLTEHFLQNNKQFLDWIAVSVDSLNDESNIKIGRALTGKKPLNKEYYYNLIEMIRNHGYGLKINTVVNSVNYEDDLNEFIAYANPKRWKVLQVLPIVGQNDENIIDFEISHDQYKQFLQTHNNIKSIVPESNDEIKGSYVMVDPAGRFFDNAQGTHNYSKPILDVGIIEAYESMNYSSDKFIARGGIYNWNNNTVNV